MRKGKLVEDAFGPCIEGPADDLITKAWEAETPAQRVKLARKALEADLNVLDAYNILGIHAATHAERIAMFREAVLIGRELFAPLMDDEEMAWWDFIGTRPWMHACHNLGLALIKSQDLEQAIDVFKLLLKLNPNDNQGIRYELLDLFAQTGNYDDCKLLFEHYERDSSIEFPATKLFFVLSGNKGAAKDLGGKTAIKKLVSDLEASNEHFLPLLKTIVQQGKWPANPKVDYLEFGSKEQAALYLCHSRDAWTQNPKTLEKAAKLLFTPEP